MLFQHVGARAKGIPQWQFVINWLRIALVSFVATTRSEMLTCKAANELSNEFLLRLTWFSRSVQKYSGLSSSIRRWLFRKPLPLNSQ